MRTRGTERRGIHRELFAETVLSFLQQRGVAAEGLSRLKELHAALDQARFGGPMPDPSDVLAAAETLAGAANG